MNPVRIYEVSNLVNATTVLGIQTSEGTAGEWLMSASCSLQCDANVANRVLVLRITTKEIQSLCVSACHTAITASQGIICMFYPETSERSIGTSVTFVYQAVAIPRLYLPPGSIITVENVNAQAGDLLEFLTFATLQNEAMTVQ